MSTVSDYWHLQRLDSSGGSRRQLMQVAQAWLQSQGDEFAAGADTDDCAFQVCVFDRWRDATGDAKAPAFLSLRCRVSHAIRLACLQLVKQFGDYYQFQGADLFPFVLTDDGKPVSRYRPLGVQVIETYTPGKSSLANWAINIARNDNDLNQFLIGQGLYRISDWALLNDTTPGQLPKVLGEFHALTPTEVEAGQQLLDCYHEVYLRDRILARQAGQSGGRCQEPSEEQLREIDATLAPAAVLAELQQLAYLIRQYRIHVRGGTPLTESFDNVNRPDWPAQTVDEAEAQQDDFLAAYRQQVNDALDAALTQTLQIYCEKMGRKKPAKATAFLKALTLFHRQGEGMKAIAPQVGLQTQVQVTRLMNLKQFRADVRNAFLTALQARIQATVLTITSPEHLQQIGDRLDMLLAADADRIIAEAAAEAQIPKNRTTNSLFARHLCTCLRSFEF